MSKRRSQRPSKVRRSEAPPPDMPAAAPAPLNVEERPSAPPQAPPLDELSALDAGWDELT